MRLLFVAHYFPLTGSDVFRTHDFSRFLGSLGNDVSIVSRMGIEDMFRIKAEESIGPVKIYRALSLDLRLAEAVLDVFQIISTFVLSLIVALIDKADFIIISVPPGVPGIGAFFAGRLLHRKLVFDVRDKWEDHSIYFSKYRLVRFTHRIMKTVYNVFYRKADLVITVTPSLVKYLKARGVVKVTLIPNGADVKLFYPRKDSEKLAIRSELGLRNGEVVFVYAGAIGGYYRPDVVIQALYNLIDESDTSKIKFIVIARGEPSKIKEMLKLVENLGLQDAFYFLGEQKRKEVARILSCCDLGVVPYDDNPLWDSAYSTKFFEYCASGLPVIATVTKNSDLATLIREHNVGYVVDPLNVMQLASVVKEFCNLSEKKRKEMGERARRLVEDLFDRSKMAISMVEALQRV